MDKGKAALPDEPSPTRRRLVHFHTSVFSTSTPPPQSLSIGLSTLHHIPPTRPTNMVPTTPPAQTSYLSPPPTLTRPHTNQVPPVFSMPSGSPLQISPPPPPYTQQRPSLQSPYSSTLSQFNTLHTYHSPPPFLSTNPSALARIPNPQPLLHNTKGYRERKLQAQTSTGAHHPPHPHHQANITFSQGHPAPAPAYIASNTDIISQDQPQQTTASSITSTSGTSSVQQTATSSYALSVEDFDDLARLSENAPLQERWPSTIQVLPPTVLFDVREDFLQQITTWRDRHLFKWGTHNAQGRADIAHLLKEFLQIIQITTFQGNMTLSELTSSLATIFEVDSL